MKDKRSITEELVDKIDDEILEKASKKRFSLFDKPRRARRKRTVLTAASLAASLALVLSVVLILGSLLNPTVTGIVSLELNDSYGKIDIYSIKYGDGTTASFVVSHGTDARVSDVTYNEDNEIILHLSTGSSVNLGSSVGELGTDDGNERITGVSIDELDNMSITLLSDMEIDLGKVPTGNESHGHTLNVAQINAAGELVIGFASGEQLNLGRVRGEDGVGIAGMQINEDGELIVTLTDGTVLNLGNIKGNDGIGISETYINDLGELCITYTDGVNVNLGRIVGERGESGVGISNIILNESYELEISLTDGRFLSLGSVRGEAGKSAYDMYREMYGYEGSEEQWLYDLVNGNLALRDSYNVTFTDPEGGTFTPTQNVGKGNKAIEPTAPVREGYEFLGWYIGNEKWSFVGYSVTSDITLCARWTPVIYSIYLELDGGYTNDSYLSSYTVLDSFTLPQPQKYGYSFIGWTWYGQTEPKKNVTVSDSTGNLRFTANYTPANFSVALNPAGGTVATENLTATYTKPLELPDVTPPRGYNFVGWFTADGNEFVSGGVWSIGEDSTLIARYTPINYTISYELDGGELSGAQASYTVLDSVSLPRPVRQHYDFIGWTWDGQSEPVLDAEIAVGTMGNLGFTANWAKCRYTVEFHSNGGVEDYSRALIWGEPIDNSPTKFDLDFGGWYTDPYFSGEAVTVVPTYDVILYAKWNGETPIDAFEHSYTVIYGIKDTTLTEIVLPTHFAGEEITVSDSFTSNTAVRRLTLYNDKDNSLSKLIEKLPSLEELVLLGNCTEIPREAFDGNTTLKSVTVNVSSTFRIEDYAFRNCTSLTSVKLLDGVSYIGYDAFKNTAITSISLPSTLTQIEDNAFGGCGAIDVYVKDYDYIWSFDVYTQYGYSDASAPMSGSPLLTGGRLFVGGELLTELVVPDYITELTGGLFNGCSSITSIKLHSGITKIANSAFYKMTEVRVIVIPEGVTEIGGHALYGCSSLEELHLPSTLKTLSIRALATNGVDIYITDLLAYCKLGYFESGHTITFAEGKFGYNRNGRLFLNGELVTELVIPEELTSVPGDVFSGCTSITKVVLHSGITAICGSAFQWCKNLVEIEIPNGVTRIETCAFNGCTSLKSIVIPNSVSHIGSEVFNDCTSLTYIFYLGDESSDLFDWSSPENLYYYSASRPDGDKKYWYYSSNGTPTVWA